MKTVFVAANGPSFDKRAYTLLTDAERRVETLNTLHGKQVWSVEELKLHKPRQEWNRRGIAKAMAEKTHCVHGHPFDEENTIRDWRGYRTCRQCAQRREQQRQQQQRKAPQPTACLHCAGELPAQWTGRPRMYCTDECREAHWRSLAAPAGVADCGYEGSRYSAYTKRGCRCDECTIAYKEATRRTRRAPAPFDAFLRAAA